MAASPAQHPVQSGVRQRHRGGQVELEGAQVLLDGHGVELVQRVAAGVVDEQVDAAVFLLDGLGQGLGCAGLSQVGGDIGHVRAGGCQVGGHGLEVGGGSAGQHYVAALAGDLGGDQRPDTAGGASDQGRTPRAQDVGSTHMTDSLRD